MKRKELGQFKMISGVCYYFRNLMHLQEEITMLKEAVSTLKELERRMWVEFSFVKETMRGITLEKSGMKVKMIALSLKLNGLMKAKSRDANNITMLKALHCSYSDLNRAKDETLVKRCTLILKHAHRQKKSLYKYGLKDEMLMELKELITNYQINVPVFKNARSKSATHHAELRKLIKEALHLLKYNIDAMMELLKDKYASDCGKYELMRKVICYGRKRKAYSGRFKDKITGETLKDVQISVVEKAEKIVTDFKNNLEATAEDFAGKVTVIIEKAGYKKMVLEDVNIMQLNELAAEMEPEEKKKKEEQKENLVEL